MSRFKDIVGQEQLKEHLQNAIRLNKVSHAYIINGERSSGKEFIAKTFAMALQCENLQTDGQDMEPCQECHSCKQALSGNHPDIIFITHEKPNTISVDDIRSQINGDVAIKPYSGPKKIYIMNEGYEEAQPAPSYVDACMQGYRDFSMDSRILLKALRHCGYQI